MQKNANKTFEQSYKILYTHQQFQRGIDKIDFEYDFTFQNLKSCFFTRLWEYTRQNPIVRNIKN